MLSFTGPEGDEARIMLKDLRTNHQEPSFSFQSSKKKEKSNFGDRSEISPIFSPWKRYSTQDGSMMNSAPPLSSIRNPRRESMGSIIDPFDRFLANNDRQDIAEVEEEDQSAERSAFQFSRDDSQMSVESPFDRRN